MKVRELIEELESCDPDADVCFAYNYGDYWRTTVAPEVQHVSDGFVKFSDYHSMLKLVNEDSEHSDEQDGEPAVILSNMRIY